jgi:hypothetical protein
MVWQLDGDELGTGLFYREAREPKRARDHLRVDEALDRLASGWLLRRYPWAGALSTAHTLLYYERLGSAAFRALAQRRPVVAAPAGRARTATARFDLERAAEALERDRAIWTELIHRRRHVSRAAYQQLADALPALRPRPGRWRYATGEPSVRRAAGRRPSHAPNALR